MKYDTCSPSGSKRSRDIWQILMAAVRDAVGKFSDVTSLDFDTVGKPDIPVFNPASDAIDAPRIDFNPQYNPFLTTAPAESVADKERHADKRRSADHASQTRAAKGWEELFGSPTERDTPSLDKADSGRTLFPSSLSWQDEADGTDSGGRAQDDVQRLVRGRATEHYQLRGSYIITQVQEGLMVTDQNRASQRILYEQYMAVLDTRNAHTQKVLFPEVVQFPPSYVPSIGEILDNLRILGFEMTDLGGGSYSVSGIPAGLGGLDTVRLVTDLVTEAMDTDNAAAERIHHILAEGLARKAATPYGEFLSNDDMETMLRQLFSCKTQRYTADGKPVISIITYEELVRRFK